MRVAALTTRCIEDARANRKSEYVDDACGLSAIALGCEDRGVFQ